MRQMVEEEDRVKETEKKLFCTSRSQKLCKGICVCVAISVARWVGYCSKDCVTCKPNDWSLQCFL